MMVSLHSGEFAAILEAELEGVAEEEGTSSVEDDNGIRNLERIKRQKVELYPGASAETIGSLPKKENCTHPGFFAGMCMKCGQRTDDKSAVPLKYIDKNLRLANVEMARLRKKDLKNLLFHRRKLYLVLDLDHTLLNSSRLTDIKDEEAYLNSERDALPDALKSSLFRLDRIQMMTKLRPYVHKFLEEASKLFEMYIYTMGDRSYALEMADLLDPGFKYFHSRIIARGDFIKKYQKSLDIILGQESAVIILDDTEGVWKKNTRNLILMDRYHFFASSCKNFGFSCSSLSQLKIDESETEGALATVLKVLRRVHRSFFDKERYDNIEDRDVRQVLKTVREEVLNGCKIVFTQRIIPTRFKAKDHRLWRMAKNLGAKCSTKIDASVTHVVSLNPRSVKSRWAVKENKFLVNPGWIQASNFLWRKQPEEKFPVTPARRR